MDKGDEWWRELPKSKPQMWTSQALTFTLLSGPEMPRASRLAFMLQRENPGGSGGGGLGELTVRLDGKLIPLTRDEDCHGANPQQGPYDEH